LKNLNIGFFSRSQQLYAIGNCWNYDSLVDLKFVFWKFLRVCRRIFKYLRLVLIWVAQFSLLSRWIPRYLTGACWEMIILVVTDGLVIERSVNIIWDMCALSMVISSTIFPHKNICNETWVSPDGQTRNQIYNVIVDGRIKRYIMDVYSIRGISIVVE